jgi:hypothetical protein
VRCAPHAADPAGLLDGDVVAAGQALLSEARVHSYVANNALRASGVPVVSQ